MPTTSVIRVSRRGVAIFAVIAATLFGFSLNAFASGNAKAVAVNVPGNNGTLKIHEQGTPSGTENNDPKVCVFNVESFGLDAGQTGYLLFSVQGGDGPTGVGTDPTHPFAFGPADDSGYFATQYFTLQPGHYKATLYGKQLPGGELTDVKAKSKVFKVTCETETTTTTTTPPPETTTTTTPPPETTTTTTTPPPETTTTTTTTPPVVAPVVPNHPLPVGGKAGQADTSGQLIAGGIAGILALAAFATAFVLYRRRYNA